MCQPLRRDDIVWVVRFVARVHISETAVGALHEPEVAGTYVVLSLCPTCKVSLFLAILMSIWLTLSHITASCLPLIVQYCTN
jgi:hypothetical protein